MILCWDKPKKVKSTDEWKKDYGFDGGPDGGYMSNMSDDDKMKWKAKLTGTTLGFPQVEIRKETKGAQITIIVSLGKGYNYKSYRAKKEVGKHSYPTNGINVHLAMNGPARLTFAEMEEMNQAILEAKDFLERQQQLLAGQAAAKAAAEKRDQ